MDVVKDPLATVGSWSRWLDEQEDAGYFTSAARSARVWLDAEGVRVDPHTAVAFVTGIVYALGCLGDDPQDDPLADRQTCLILGEFYRQVLGDLTRNA